MRIKVSDYIAEFLVQHNINTIFTVVGGGAMHMNDSFGHKDGITCIYNHHEQASAMAAEAYARIHGSMAAVCVTSGPGAINALNGVAGAYQDSISMMVFSGQSKSTLLVKTSGLKLRTLGPQEFDIVSALENFTKYAETIFDAKKIRYYLEKAYFLAISGRPGPTWLDIPLDIQGSFVETDELEGYDPSEDIVDTDSEELIESDIAEVISHLKKAKRPVIYAGNGIRIAGAADDFLALVHKLRVPVVTCWDSIDLIADDDDCYCGRGGTMGNRAGNFAVQNSDFLLCIGTRLNIYQAGYNVKTWARAAFVAAVDIDREEMKKNTVHIELPICCDAKIFIEKLAAASKSEEIGDHEDWIRICNNWKKKYPVVSQVQYDEKDETNVYAFIDSLSRRLPDNAVTVVANGSASVVGSQTYYIRQGQRFVMNCGISSMGYDLPAAVGACVANDRKAVICIAGDGSIMMNLQELQTIITNRLPVKIFVINNNGYHQIRQTQHNVFKEHDLVGVGPESHDLSFPDFEKLSEAFGYHYYAIHNNSEFATIDKALTDERPVFVEVYCSITQNFEPKSATKKLPDGTLVSPPLEDLVPFLSREELAENMFIPLVDEK